MGILNDKFPHVRDRHLDVTHTFDDLDMDSLALMELSMELEDRYGVELDVSDLKAHHSLDDAVRIVSGLLV
ncbi:acyl carrier protein [Streptomyces sp. NPDC001941]|uniref:acyl carrier protein n=1 Tax=Streptomyces sp. NPDC001941 TaxID=3154659 RepID=UPI0033307E6F